MNTSQSPIFSTNSDEAIKTLLLGLQRDLQSQQTVIFWGNPVPQTLNERQAHAKKVQMILMVSEICLALMVLVLMETQFPQELWLRILVYVMTALSIFASQIFTHQRLLPNILNNETKILVYRLDFAKQILETYPAHQPRQRDVFRFHENHVVLASLPLPQTETQTFAQIRQEIEQEINQRTGWKFY